MKKICIQSGFTLIETLVAIAILMVAIAGPLNIAEKGLTTAVDSRDQVVASYLAQDMMEFVKNVRDDNLEASPVRAWLNGVSQCTVSSPCTAETATGDPNNLGTTVSSAPACNFFSYPVVLDNSCRLYVDVQHNPGGYYTYNSTGNNQSTQFYRTFYITQPTGADSDTALLNVSVYWTNGTILNHVIEQTMIFNTTR